MTAPHDPGGKSRLPLRLGVSGDALFAGENQTQPETFKTRPPPMTERFVSPCPPPTARESELLACLIEECAEVQQRATKMLRFGVFEVQPGQPLSNKQRLGAEVGDLECALTMVVKAGLIDLADVDAGMTAKRRQLARFLQHGE